jgi:hypothetical protein
MERTVQVLAAHCALKQSSDILASPGTMLASALTTDREQQEQHILTPASAKAAPAQCHAHHCSICGAARHTQAHTHACVHTYKYKRAQLLTGAHTHVHMHTHKHTDTRAHIQMPKHTAHTRAHTQTHIHAQSHAHMHMHAHVARVMGFANFSASLVTLPYLSFSHCAFEKSCCLFDICDYTVVFHCLRSFFFFSQFLA